LPDATEPLTAEGMDDAMAESLRNRLDALDRALRCLDYGTYGRSIRRGVPNALTRPETSTARSPRP